MAGYWQTPRSESSQQRLTLRFLELAHLLALYTNFYG
jgi:hypothetical protein